MISLAIIEDDRDIREAVYSFLGSQENILAEWAGESVEAFLAAIDADNLPDVILMDIGLPGISGIGGIQLIKDRYPDIDIIMFTVHNDSHKIFQSISAGASGYLLKNSPFEEIKKTIEIVSAGGSRMSPEIARKVIEHFQNPRPRKESPLTSREKEVVQGLVDGLSYKMIAGQMKVSLETVRTHIKNIYQKLHIHCKADVIRKSLRGEI